MVQINFAQKTVNVKIVYYGPGMSGKTTNLEVVHQRAPSTNRGELTSISTDGDRTLFFDYMPLDLGTVAGMRTCFQVYTVPGQVYYNSTRKLVLQGVDGVIFVADSSASMLDQNIESLRNLEENLNEYGKSLSSIPHVMQWNKRDLPDAMSVEELERHLNHHRAASFEAIANTGQGVFPTLKAMAAVVLKGIMQEAGGPKATSGTAIRPVAGSARPAGAPSPRPAIPRDAPAVEPAFHPAAAPVPAERTPLSVAAQAAPAAPAARPAVRTIAATAPAAAAPSSPAAVMRTVPKLTPVQRSDPRPHKMPVAGSPRRSRPAAAPAPVAAPRRRGNGVFTGMFVLLAAGAGALLAWVVLSVL
ncbi:MAG: ADP-ribosylation factor-like protein [Planctomycetota bacterium]